MPRTRNCSKREDSKHNQKTRNIVLLERWNAAGVFAQQHVNRSGRAVAAPDPDNARRSHGELAALLKIGIFGHDRQAVLKSETPNFIIRRSLKSCVTYMERIRKRIRKIRGQRWRKILVEQQLQAGSVICRRSRSAA